MQSKMLERRRARASAVSLLYSSDITEAGLVQIVDEGAYPADFELSEYAEDLLRGIAGNLDEIDARIASTSQNWAIDRMPAVDRAILRLAVYEMLYVSQVPVSVAINEAVELAKSYGGEDDSARFVNGVLGCIARDYEAGVPVGGFAADSEAADDDADEVDEAEAGELAAEVEADEPADDDADDADEADKVDDEPAADEADEADDEPADDEPEDGELADD